MLRVRKDHTCISLELCEKDEKYLCDKCYIFYERQQGIGRKLKTGSVTKYEKPWYIINKDC